MKKTKRKSLTQLFSYSLILLLFISCAQQVSLTGGEQDVKPPAILKQEPPNYTTNFNASQIRIYFDEYIVLDNPSENFLISPPLKNQPEYTLKKKSLIINLNNELAENTTYIITCNQGIKDLTEGNFLPLTSFVFSTGDYIDSMSLVGTVKDAFTMQNEEKIGVILYKQDEDSALLKDLPYYYVTTDKDGKFMFTNIADGEYQLYALMDKNRNYLFDQKDERVAFSTDLVKPVYIPPAKQVDTVQTDSTLTDSTRKVVPEKDFVQKDSLQTDSTQSDSTMVPAIDYSANTLFLFEEQDTTTRFIRRDFKGNYRHDFVFKNEIQGFKLNQISNLDTVVTYLTEYNKTKDTISVFFTAVSNNLIDFELFANDQLLDTLNFNPAQMATSTRKASKTDTAANYTTFNEITKGELNKNPEIRFVLPIQTFDLTKCTLIEYLKNDTNTLPVECYFTDSIKRSLAFKYPFKEKTNYTIICPDSVFYSYFGACNDSIRIKFTTKSSKDYGSIRIAYQFYEENNFIVQLLSEKSDVVQEDFIRFNKAITYNYLQAGKYRVRVIVDANNNKRWDSGDFPSRRQPEKIIYFEKTLDLAPNWKIEETFDVVIPM
jgi:uncharacterized protein (DUF2141 family)